MKLRYTLTNSCPSLVDGVSRGHSSLLGLGGQRKPFAERQGQLLHKEELGPPEGVERVGGALMGLPCPHPSDVHPPLPHPSLSIQIPGEEPL